jgi:uncharacterized protein (TIGR03083 family)
MGRRLPSGAVNAPQHSPDWYADHFDRATVRFADLLDEADLEAPVPSSADWTIASLAAHLGWVHQWARHCIERRSEPTTDDFRPVPLDADRPAEWYRDTASTLGASLRDLDPDAPTWHPFPVERVGRIWPRRQAHEATMHLWDLERAVGDPSPIDAELASDGIDEYFELVVPRLVARRGAEIVPRSSFHVHCTDVEGEWLVWNEDGEYRMRRAHEKGDAALRGPAEVLLLALWRRPHGRRDELSPVGDESALDAWLSIGGM